MKTIILALALAAISFSLPSVAQTPCNCPKGCTPQTCEAPCKPQCGTTNCKPAKCDKPCPLFEGITLTDSQKEAVAAVEKKYRSARADKMKAQRNRRQQCDSTVCAERKAEKKQYLADMKSALTPEQYVVFLENYYINDNMMNNRMRPGKMYGDKAPRQRRGDASTNCRVPAHPKKAQKPSQE